MEKFIIDGERVKTSEKVEIARNIIEMVELETTDIADITPLAITLASMNNANSLKLLNLLVQATTFKKLKKDLWINWVYPAENDFGNKYHTNVVFNLIRNQLNLSRDVLSSIKSIQEVAWDFRPYGEGGEMLYEIMVGILNDINNPNSLFYKREDLAKKNLDILRWFVAHDVINFENIRPVLEKFNLSSNNDLLNAPLLSMSVDGLYAANWCKSDRRSYDFRKHWFADDFELLDRSDVIYTEKNIQRLVRENLK